MFSSFQFPSPLSSPPATLCSFSKPRSKNKTNYQGWISFLTARAKTKQSTFAKLKKEGKKNLAADFALGPESCVFPFGATAEVVVITQLKPK